MLILLIQRVRAPCGTHISHQRSVANKQHLTREQTTSNASKTERATSDNLLTAFSKAFFKYARYTLNVFIVGAIFYSSPAFWKTLNEGSRYLGRQPRPTYSLTQSYEEELPLDNFARNYRGFDEVQSLISSLNINQSSLDLDGSNIALDNSDEILELRSKILKAKREGTNQKRLNDAALLLDEIDTTSQLIWGRSGPDPDKVQQALPTNCQVMADIQGHLLTPQNIQKIKGQITVENFNPSLKDFRIDTQVKLNGETINIPYEVLVQWMMPIELASIQTGEGALSTPILTYAIEKGLQKYGGVPNWFPSASLTLLSGNDYCTIATTTLSDDELINILSKAPETLTKLDTSGFNFKDLKDVDYIGYWANVFSPQKQNTKLPAEELTRIDASRRHFVNSVQPLIQQIESDKTQQSITNTKPHSPSSKEAKQKVQSTIDDLLSEHMYTVKKFDPQRRITTIIDAQGLELDLTLDQVREHANFIISTTQNFPNIGTRGLKAIFLGLVLLLSINKGPQAVKKLVAKTRKANNNAST